MSIRNKLSLVILFLPLLACAPGEDQDSSTDINGIWAVTSIINSDSCYPEDIGSIFSSLSMLIVEEGQILLPNGTPAEGTNYSDRLLTIKRTDTSYGITDQFSARIEFTDNNNAIGTSQSIETDIDANVCTSSDDISMNRYVYENGFNANPNGSWLSTTTITYDNCDLVGVGNTLTETFIFSQKSYEITVTGDQDLTLYFYNGLLFDQFSSYNPTTKRDYGTSLILKFIDNNTATGFSSNHLIEPATGSSCTLEGTEKLERI